MSEGPDHSYRGYKLSTLERLPALDSGDLITCVDCGEMHTAHGGRQLFVVCRGATRLAGVAGRLVLGVKPDAGDR